MNILAYNYLDVVIIHHTNSLHFQSRVPIKFLSAFTEFLHLLQCFSVSHLIFFISLYVKTSRLHYTGIHRKIFDVNTNT